MASLEEELIGRIVLDSDLLTPIDFGIEADYFFEADTAMAWKWLLKAWKSSGGLPSPAKFKRFFPNFNLQSSGDALDTLCVEMLQNKARVEIQRLVNEAETQLEEPGTDPINVMLQLQREAAVFTSSMRTMALLDLAKSSDRIKEAYLEREAGDGIDGVPFPWDPLNKETRGMRPGQFLLFYGRPKNMKTFVACHIAANAYWKHHASVLFYTREMTPEEIQERIAADIAQVDYGGLSKGRLAKKDKRKLFDALDHLHLAESDVHEHLGKRKWFLITSDREMGSSGGGTSSLRALVQKLRPDILVVDGVYLVRNDRTGMRSVKWDNLADVISDIKDIAMDFQIPVLGTTQENRESEGKKRKTVAGISFADAFGMYCDGAANVVKRKAAAGGVELHITFPAWRNADLEGLVIGGKPCTDFRFKRVIKEKLEDEDGDGGGGGGRMMG